MARSPHKYTGILNTDTGMQERFFQPVDIDLPDNKKIVGGDTLELYLADAGANQAKISESALSELLNTFDAEQRQSVEQAVRAGGFVVDDAAE